MNTQDDIAAGNSMTNDYTYKNSLMVRYSEVAPEGCATPAAIAGWLQEAAGHSALSLGFGPERLYALGLAWVLTRFSMRIARLPDAGEIVTVCTWPAQHDRHMGYRAYQLFDAAGALLAEATGVWVILDLTTRTMREIPQELMEVYPQNTKHVSPPAPRVLPRLRARGQGSPLLVRRADLDQNGHVNNTHYIAWLFETLDEAAYPLTSLRSVDITYRAECFPGDTLMIGQAPGEAGPDGKVLIHALRRESDDSEVCRAMTIWKE